jgi:hypothetical protein
MKLMAKKVIAIFVLSLLCCGEKQQARQTLEPNAMAEREKPLTTLDSNTMALLAILEPNTTAERKKLLTILDSNTMTGKEKISAILELNAMSERIPIISALLESYIITKKTRGPDRKLLEELFDSKIVTKRERNAITRASDRKFLKNYLEKVKAEYREEFNIEPPDWDLEEYEEIPDSNYNYRSWPIESKMMDFLYEAISMAVPYYTKEEKMAIKSQSKEVEAEYKKRFGVNITDYELSVERVYFRIGEFGASPPRLLVARTAIGAFAKYSPYGGEKLFKRKLDMGEWLDFIRALYECRIDKWEEYYNNSTALDGTQWTLKIFSLDRDLPYESGGSNRYPQNWEKFEKIMKGMETKIKKGGTLSTTAK